MTIDIILPIWRCSTINQQYNISHDLGTRVFVIFKYKMFDYWLLLFRRVLNYWIKNHNRMGYYEHRIRLMMLNAQCSYSMGTIFTHGRNLNTWRRPFILLRMYKLQQITTQCIFMLLLVFGGGGLKFLIVWTIVSKLSAWRVLLSSHFEDLFCRFAATKGKLYRHNPSLNNHIDSKTSLTGCSIPP